MIEILIPGRDKLEIQNIVFDYNGTLAVDGTMSFNTKKMLIKIKEFVNVFILTADTYGTVKKECSELGVEVKTFPREGAAAFKMDIVKSLKGDTICVGNGYNDIEMFRLSELSVAIIGKEGCCGKLIACADIVVNSIEDVFELIMKHERIKATLRS
jgi:soluble P-type ATPase